MRENPNQPTINVRDWKQEKPSAFLRDYIQIRGLRYSVGFALYDLNANIRTVALPWTVSEGVPLHQSESSTACSFSSMSSTRCTRISIIRETGCGISGRPPGRRPGLTAREIEVVDLLVQGVSPANISKILYISQSTTYKHIAHIYEKMGVSSQQELLVKLLRKAE